MHELVYREDRVNRSVTEEDVLSSDRVVGWYANKNACVTNNAIYIEIR